MTVPAPTTSPATTTATPLTVPSTTLDAPKAPPASTPSAASGNAPVATPKAAPEAVEPPAQAGPDVQKLWNELGKKERMLLDREKAISGGEKRLKQFETAFARAKEDPAGALDALAEQFGVPDLFDKAATARVSRKRVDPHAQKALSEVESMRRELYVERALPYVQQGASVEQIAAHLGIDVETLTGIAGDERFSKRFDEAIEARTQWQQDVFTRHDEQTQTWVREQKAADGSPRYRFTTALGNESLVFQLIQQHHADTAAEGEPVVLTPEAAADIIEEQLRAKSETLRAKLNEAFGPPVAPPAPTGKAPQTPQTHPPATRPPTTARTLSNAAAQDDSEAAREPSTDRDRIAAAAKVLRTARSAHSKP